MRAFIKVLLLFMATALTAEAQTIKGTVLAEENGQLRPVSGANVYWAGTSKGTTTNSNGRFALSKEDNFNMLVVSFSGYKADTLEILGQNDLTAILTAGSTLNEVIISDRRTGTHYDRNTVEHVQLINSSELVKAACCNLSESFETNPSVDVSYSDAVSGAKRIQLLGLSGRYIQMMTENYPNFRGLASIYGLEYIPGPWMESIQVSKGAASVVNGYEAIAGQINVEYLKPHTADKFHLNLFASDDSRYEANLYAGTRINERWSALTLAHLRTNSHFEDMNHDHFADLPLSRQVNVFHRWDYSHKGYTAHLGIKVIAENRKSGQEDFLAGRSKPENPSYGIEIKTQRAEVFSKTGGLLPWGLKSSFGWINVANLHTHKSFYGLTTYDASQFSYYSNLILQSHIGSEKHAYSTGISFQLDATRENLTGLTDKPGELVPGVFFQYTFSPNEQLRLMAGMRIDLHNLYGTLYTPRIHLKYSPYDWIQLKASAGAGHRTPRVIAENSYLLASSRHLNIAPNLDMEKGINYGAALTFYIPAGKRQIVLNGEYFRTDFLTQVVVDMDAGPDQVQFYNLNGQSYSNAFQVDMSYTPLRGLDATIALRINDVKTTYGNILRTAPLQSQTKGLVALSYLSRLKKWQFDLNVQYNGSGRIPSTATNPEPYQIAETFAPYTIANFQLTKKFRHWSLYAGVENIGNFRQANPILGAEDPFGDHFDGSLIWGPVHGRKLYAGFRMTILR